MGLVNFDTDVDKNVNINKNVNVNVNKNVQTNVDLDGSLASAEASADAVGGGGGGGGGGATLAFLLDDGSDLQTTVVNSDVPENTGVAPGDDVPPPIFDPTLPDGATFNGTDIPEPRLRTFHLDLLDPDAPGIANLRSGQGNRLGFSNDDETASNQDITWESGTPFAVVLPESEFSLTNNVLIIEDIIFDPGEGTDPTEPATLRVEIQFTDSDGDSNSGAVYFTDDPAAGGGFLDGQDFVIPLGTFNGELPAGGPGQVLAPGIVNVGSTPGNPALDFENLVEVELRVLDDPATGSFDNPGLSPGENPATGATDISVDLIRFFSEDEDNDVFNIAETETFAQVTEEGAFSFSDSLAATNAAAVDALL